MEEDVFTREVKQRRRQRQQECRKSNRLRLAKQPLCTYSRFFVHFFAVIHAVTTRRRRKSASFHAL